MALFQVSWTSELLRRKTSFWALLPELGTPPFAVLYLLHGLTDDHTVWLRQTRIEAYVENLPLIVVMPDGGRSYYTNHAAGPPWASHMAQELPAFVERNFPTRTDRQGRCITGLSMGGYGALRLALGYPQRYGSATSHSGAMGGPGVKRGAVTQQEFEQIIGGKFQGSDHDLQLLAERALKRRLLPRLRMDCGTEDFLLEENRLLHRGLEQIGVPHEYAEFSGEHNWEYWNIHVRQSIAFHLKSMEATVK